MEGWWVDLWLLQSLWQSIPGQDTDTSVLADAFIGLQKCVNVFVKQKG